MLSNQSVSVHESLAPSASGLSPLPLSVVRSVLSSSQVFGGWAPAAVSLSGRYQNVLLLLNLTMIA